MSTSSGMSACGKAEKKSSPAARLSQVVERYADTTWLRTVVAAIPYVGGSLDLVLTHRGQSVARERVEHALTSLARELESIREENIRWEFLDSEEWVDLVRRALDRVSKTRQKEHRIAIARVLAGAVTGTLSETGYAERLIDVLADLREDEALVLRALLELDVNAPNTTPSAEARGVELRQIEVGTVPRERVRFVVKRLEALGLVEEVLVTYPGRVGGLYAVSETGRVLCRLAYTVG